MNASFIFLSLIFSFSFSFNHCYASPGFSSKDKSADPNFSAGEPYGLVREKLIKDGWSPVLSPDADACMNGDKRCENRPEMEACSGSGLAPCKFVWKKNNHELNVFTLGADATDEGDAGFDSLEIVELNSEK